MTVQSIQSGIPVPSGMNRQIKTQPADFNNILAKQIVSARGNVSPTQSGMPQAAPQGGGGNGIPDLVKIGTVTSKVPTVSNLLISHPSYKKDCWRIVLSDVNHDKPYRRIRAGTDIYYDPSTKELLWGKMIKEQLNGTANPIQGTKKELPPPTSYGNPTKNESVAVTQPPKTEVTQADAFNEKLLGAIEPLIGKPYEEMNCFELLVNGLKKIGFTYNGREGFGRKLISMALNRGLPMNAYLNGEGLVRFTDGHIFTQSVNKVTNPDIQAQSALKKMTPFFDKGNILSFSTETRGHTGIISKNGDAWTYINSGVMDHPVGMISSEKGVGEENLQKEITSWFHLAAKRDESLKITIGRLNGQKLAAYQRRSGRTA
ncbi:MAG: hypothetical protein JRH15_18440 [Deltaproteobacteria bacterium]|nr:hypothetical protein [Deltaproteobacteria bacterium]